jgi:hypothetical protein
MTAAGFVFSLGWGSNGSVDNRKVTKMEILGSILLNAGL